MAYEHSKSRSTLRIHQMDDVESFGHHTTLELAPRHNNNNNNNAVPTNSSEGVRERSLNLPEDPNRPLYKPHQSANAQYLRDAILGVNDGLVSMFLLILGLAGGNLTSQQILLAGITGAAAGAISMALGEYIATKSQAQVTKAELELEKEHLMFHREKEIAEVKTFLEELSLEGELLDRVLTHISKNDSALIRIMSAFEFGFQEELERNPLKAMLMSGCLFISGSLPSVIPFAVTSNVHDALIASVVLCACTLFFVGAIKTRTTKGPWLWDGLENLLLGAIGGGITYALGAAYEAGSNN